HRLLGVAKLAGVFYVVFNRAHRPVPPQKLLSPQGSPNSAAAYQLRNQVRAELASRGIASSKIVNTYYAAAGHGDAAPIRLSFTGTTAITTQCGQWP
ncbi:CpaD family pilus assembly lipoprotein, partial [Rhizobium ruizarguesonis]